jgi:WD40 repeat protein
VGTENGCVGTLDITSHKYTTLLRSHSDSVNVVAFDNTGERCVSGSSDGTIRIWDIATYQQLCVRIDAYCCNSRSQCTLLLLVLA